MLLVSPSLFILSAAALVGGAVFASLGERTARRVSIGLLLVVSGAASFLLNWPTNAEIRELTSGDRGWNGFAAPLDSLALITRRTNPWSNQRSDDCTEICQRLLYDGSVRAVLIGESGEGDAVPPFKPDDRVTRYRIDRRSSCPNVKVPAAGSWNDEARPGTLISDSSFISDRVKARIAAGECLIAEPATLAAAAAIVIDRRIKTARDNVYEHPWNLALDTVTADRLSVYEGAGAEVSREVFRRTAIEAYPIFALLWIGIQDRCGGGVCETRLAIGRAQSKINSNDPREFFKTKSGLNVAAIDDLPTASIAALVGAALADASLRADSPNLKLVDRYLKSLADRGGSDQDVDLLSRILADPRTTDLFYLAGAVRKLGGPAASLAGPLVQRIFASELPRDRTLVQSLAGAVENLPDGAMRNAVPELRALADDKLHGVVAWRALVRLADAGEMSVPILLNLVDAGQGPGAAGGGENDLLVAGLKGLCRLGADGRAATPALVEFIEAQAASRTRLFPYLKPTGELAVAALARQGAEQELEHFVMAHEDLRDQVSRRARREKMSPLDRACYY